MPFSNPGEAYMNHASYNGEYSDDPEPPRQKVVVIAIVSGDPGTWSFSRVMHIKDPKNPDWNDLVKKIGAKIHVSPYYISEMFIVNDLIKYGDCTDWREAALRDAR